MSARENEKVWSQFAYGDIPETEDELLLICQRLLVEIGEIPQLNGFVWTQLTDVQQVDGLLYFDRRAKIPVKEIMPSRETHERRTELA